MSRSYKKTPTKDKERMTRSKTNRSAIHQAVRNIRDLYDGKDFIEEPEL